MLINQFVVASGLSHDQAKQLLQVMLLVLFFSILKINSVSHHNLGIELAI